VAVTCGETINASHVSRISHIRHGYDCQLYQPAGGLSSCLAAVLYTSQSCCLSLWIAIGNDDVIIAPLQRTSNSHQESARTGPVIYYVIVDVHGTSKLTGMQRCPVRK